MSEENSTSERSRRNVLKKTGKLAAGAGVLSTAASGSATAGECVACTHDGASVLDYYCGRIGDVEYHDYGTAYYRYAIECDDLTLYYVAWNNDPDGYTYHGHFVNC